MDALVFNPIFPQISTLKVYLLLLILNEISNTSIIFRFYGRAIQHDRKDQFAGLACWLLFLNLIGIDRGFQEKTAGEKSEKIGECRIDTSVSTFSIFQDMGCWRKKGPKKE